MLAPVFTHINAGDSSIAHASPPLAPHFSESRGQIFQKSQHRRKDEVLPDSGEMSTGPRDQASGNFAAELKVINRHAHSFNPTWTPLNPEPDVRQRDNREIEREASPLFFCNEDSGLRRTVHNRQPVLQDAQRPRLATFDGNDDWNSFQLPFERRARKYGWTAAERVDRLHECLRGASIRYVC